MDRQTLLAVYGIYLGALTLITFIIYGIDKLKAKNGGWRIPEKTLILMSLLGGGLGGIIAMNLFRHKTSGEHWYFTVLNVLGVIVHAAMVILIAFVFKF